MKDLFRIFAEQNRAADQAVVHILDAQSPSDREQNRGSYYKSLSGLLRHIVGAEMFFASLFKEPLAHNEAASKVIAVLTGIAVPRGDLTQDQWKEMTASLTTADNAFVDLINALSDADFRVLVALNWFKGNPAAVPVSFLLQSLILHNTHHRGQISQIFDELNIDNDYSGISPVVLK
jgi:uncharacterized damage-inducible protein DinB